MMNALLLAHKEVVDPHLAYAAAGSHLEAARRRVRHGHIRRDSSPSTRQGVHTERAPTVVGEVADPRAAQHFYMQRVSRRN